MSTLKLCFITKSGQITVSEGIATFRLDKQVYTPYSLFSGTAYGTFSPETFRDIYRIQFRIDDEEMHLGTVDSFCLIQEKGVTCLRFSSRGLTAMLMHNQLEPGLHSATSLDSLMENFIQLPSEITWERNTDTSNYLFVKDNASMWDGSVHLTYKLCQRYPFICHANEIRMHLPTSYHTYSLQANSLLRMGITANHSCIYSDYYMADADGTYGKFHQTDATAVSYGIVRTKHLPLDRQYLYDPDQALIYRQKFAERGLFSYYFDCPGAVPAILGDRLTYGTLVQNAPITHICMTGNQSGIRTRLEAYEDAFFSSSDQS